MMLNDTAARMVLAHTVLNKAMRARGLALAPGTNHRGLGRGWFGFDVVDRETGEATGIRYAHLVANQLVAWQKIPPDIG